MDIINAKILFFISTQRFRKRNNSDAVNFYCFVHALDVPWRGYI